MNSPAGYGGDKLHLGYIPGSVRPYSMYNSPRHIISLHNNRFMVIFLGCLCCRGWSVYHQQEGPNIQSYYTLHKSTAGRDSQGIFAHLSSIHGLVRPSDLR